jgi:hypothetical protein
MRCASLSLLPAIVAGLHVTPAQAQTLPFSQNVAVAVAGHYSDLCSQRGIRCGYAYSVDQRLVVGAQKAFQLARFRDRATVDVGFTGPNFLVNTQSAAAFGCTSVAPATCGFSKIYDQKGTGCDPAQTTISQMMPYQLWAPHGMPVAVSTDRLVKSSVAHWLTATGCSLVAGAVPKSIIVTGNSSPAFIGPVGGNIGLMEDRVYSDIRGAMSAWTIYNPNRNTYVGWDFEGDGTSLGKISPATLDYVGISTYSGSTNLANVFYNNVRILRDHTPSVKVNTQRRMNIGCDGDQNYCGPVFFETAVVTTNDVSLVSGLPTRIYTYETNVVSGFNAKASINGISPPHQTFTANTPNAPVGSPAPSSSLGGSDFSPAFTGSLSIISFPYRLNAASM